jgi:hypothetical protein
MRRCHLNSEENARQIRANEIFKLRERSLADPGQGVLAGVSEENIEVTEFFCDCINHTPGDSHVRAFVHKQSGGGEPNAAITTCDQGNFVSEFHEQISLRLNVDFVWIISVIH